MIRTPTFSDIPQCNAIMSPYRCVREDDGHFVHLTWGYHPRNENGNLPTKWIYFIHL